MQLQLLSDTQVVSVYYDTLNDWLFADWRGDLNLAQVQTGCLTIAQCFLEHPYPRILNSNCDVTSMTTDVPQWLSDEYLPHLGLAGIEYLAWVCAPSLLLKRLTSEAVRQLRTPALGVFDDLNDAFAWLHYTPSLVADALPLSPAERQADLNKRVNRLAQELQHYQQAAGRPVSKATPTR